jgi:hypothetical protein
MPAPTGNTNAVTHGVRSYLATGRLPSGCASIQRARARIRRLLIDEVVRLRKKVTVFDQALVQSAVRHETVALLCAQWLAEKPDMGLEERLSLMKQLRSATDARDGCLVKLRLDAENESNILDAFYTNGAENA